MKGQRRAIKRERLRALANHLDEIAADLSGNTPGEPRIVKAYKRGAMNGLLVAVAELRELIGDKP